MVGQRISIGKPIEFARNSYSEFLETFGLDLDGTYESVLAYRTRNLCHRGAVEFAHENTLGAYLAAFELGADENETDNRMIAIDQFNSYCAGIVSRSVNDDVGLLVAASAACRW